MPKPRMLLSLRYTFVVSLFGLLFAHNSSRHYLNELDSSFICRFIHRRNSNCKHIEVYLQLLFLNYFCLGLDMRVTQVVEANIRKASPLQQNFQPAVRGARIGGLFRL